MLETRSAVQRLRPLGLSPATETKIAGLSIRLAPASARFSLRLRAAALPRAVAGVRLDQGINRLACEGERASLRLGPDEWVIIGPEADLELIQGEVEEALAGMPHSLVDVSHRDVTFEIAGAGAEVALNAGCPLDLDPRAFPAGSATRTLLGKAEIVLARRGEASSFEVTCWRSFATYVHGFLIEAAHGLG